MNVLCLSIQWGKSTLPFTLIHRYAVELNQPYESVALAMDKIRGSELKKLAREYVRHIIHVLALHIQKYFVSSFIIIIQV